MPGKDCLLVKTASEISLKTTFVRQFFTKKLVESIKFSLKKNGIGLKSIAKSGGRLYVFCDDVKKAQGILLNVSGIHAIAIASYYEPADYKTVEEKTLEYAKPFLKKGDEFALDANAKNSKDFSSKDLENKIGAKIMSEIPGLKVNLNNPGKKIFVEARAKDFFIYTGQEPSLGGLPLGVEGSVAFFFEGKKKELLAAFLLMHRGCNIFPVVKKSSPELKKQLEKLVPFNCFRDFELTEEKDFSKLVESRKIKAVGTADYSLDEKSLKEYEEFNKAQRLVVLRPLLLYPDETGKRFGNIFY